MSRPERLRRSELSTPGTNPKMMAKAADSDADLAFLDLEDAVAPAHKEAARQHVVAALTELDWGRKTRACRINGVHTPWCHDDLIDVVSGVRRCLDVIIVPKVKAPRDVWFVDDLLTQLERKLGLEVGRIGLEVLIEETEALACVEAIAASSARLEALILGVGDLSASQGIRAGRDSVRLTPPLSGGHPPSPGGGAGAGGESLAYPGDMWHYARNRLIVAARANGLDAIDGPYADFGDAAGYRREAAWSATLGAVGKWCIHPSQIAVANDVFAPTQAEIDGALQVVDAVRAAEAEGLGAANVGGMMVDAATARIFEGVLRRARLCGLLT